MGSIAACSKAAQRSAVHTSSRHIAAAKVLMTAKRPAASAATPVAALLSMHSFGIRKQQGGRAVVPAVSQQPVAFVGAAYPAAGERPLEIRTVDGRLLRMLVSPTTTIRQIREMVAAQTRTDTSSVRLAYAGRELDPAKDDDYFEIKADNAVMHTMQRMKGGSCNSS